MSGTMWEQQLIETTRGVFEVFTKGEGKPLCETVSNRLDSFSYKELPHFDLRPQLPTVKTRAYIYGGLYDAQCPYEFAVEAADLLPNATLTTFAESNHHPVIEEEEKFSEFVRDLSQLHSLQ